MSWKVPPGAGSGSVRRLINPVDWIRFLHRPALNIATGRRLRAETLLSDSEPLDRLSMTGHRMPRAPGTRSGWLARSSAMLPAAPGRTGGRLAGRDVAAPVPGK